MASPINPPSCGSGARPDRGAQPHAPSTRVLALATTSRTALRSTPSNRRMPVPKYSARVSGGWLTVRTSQATLRYKVGSGPFTPANTSLQLRRRDARRGHRASHVGLGMPLRPDVPGGAAVLAWWRDLSWGQSGYESSAGYVGQLMSHTGASATWNVLGAPAGPAELSIRYSNVAGAQSGSAPQHHRPGRQRTASRHTGGAPDRLRHSRGRPSTTTASLSAGSNSVEVRCGSDDSCNVEIDTLSIGPADAPAPIATQTDPSGGWVRGFDTFTYEPAPTVCTGHGRSHVPEHLRAAAHRRVARPRRLAAARRHPERRRGHGRDGSNRAPQAETSRTDTCSPTARTTRARCARSHS